MTSRSGEVCLGTIFPTHYPDERRVVTVGGTKSDTGGAADLEMRAVAPIWVDRATCAAGDRAAFRELSTLWRSYLSIWSTSKLAELMPPRIQRGWPVLSGRWCLGVSAALKPVRPRAGKQSPALACIEAGHVAAHSMCRACQPCAPTSMGLSNVGEQSFVHSMFHLTVLCVSFVGTIWNARAIEE